MSSTLSSRRFDVDLVLFAIESRLDVDMVSKCRQFDVFFGCNAVEQRLHCSEAEVEAGRGWFA